MTLKEFLDAKGKFCKIAVVVDGIIVWDTTDINNPKYGIKSHTWNEIKDTKVYEFNIHGTDKSDSPYLMIFCMSQNEK